MQDAVLIVEDEEALRGALKRYLTRKGFRVLESENCADAFKILDTCPVQLILCDVLLPDGLGFELADRAARQNPEPSVIVMTGNGTLDNAIRALQHGAADFLQKPFSFDALDDAFTRARQRRVPLPTSPVKPSEQTPIEEWRDANAPGILGRHPSLLRVFSIIERVGDTDCSILVTGESGTGKELIARAVHTASTRSTKPFVTVNCAAIPDNLLESELFGHVRGAFTGATNSRIGRFSAADEGTLFLDEIGELPLALQAKLLRVLQEKEVTPVGETKHHKVDVRVIAATNVDLEEAVEGGVFREDLLYRLNVIPIELPKLRERRSDIPELVEQFIQRMNERRDRRISGIAQSALDAICSYDWPGNVRQLENTIERMVVLKSDGELELEDLPAKVRNNKRGSPILGSPELPEAGINLRDAVESFENALILQALERTGWNKNRAASILQMNRTTLVEKLKKKQFNVELAQA
ncbi:MAG: sigma-54 dependent transcriptional regulator [Myxococcota bacterium]